mmetsp:Transcript_20611/g.45142  ORF Transcript_20611/g.45142 Transcript_20611/m.45142 type:complete len:401 (-) Transcript_20611:130-1332(-)
MTFIMSLVRHAVRAWAGACVFVCMASLVDARGRPDHRPFCTQEQMRLMVMQTTWQNCKPVKLLQQNYTSPMDKVIEATGGLPEYLKTRPYAKPASSICLATVEAMKYAQTTGFGLSCKNSEYIGCQQFLNSDLCVDLMEREARTLFGIDATERGTRTTIDLKNAIVNTFSLAENCRIEDKAYDGLCLETIEGLHAHNFTQLLGKAVKLQFTAKYMKVGKKIREFAELKGMHLAVGPPLPEAPPAPKGTNRSTILGLVGLFGVVAGIYHLGLSEEQKKVVLGKVQENAKNLQVMVLRAMRNLENKASTSDSSEGPDLGRFAKTFALIAHMKARSVGMLTGEDTDPPLPLSTGGTPSTSDATGDVEKGSTMSDSKNSVLKPEVRRKLDKLKAPLITSTPATG